MGASQPMFEKVGSKPPGSRATHHHDGDQEGVFAADQIADTAEEDGAERPYQEARRIGCEGGEQCGRVISGWKEQRGEERRQRGVEIKVVPLEDRAEREAKMTNFSSFDMPRARADVVAAIVDIWIAPQSLM